MADGHGGARKGSGRKPDWFRQLARDLLSEEIGPHNRTRLHMVADMADGKYTGPDGKEIEQTIVVGRGKQKKVIKMPVFVEPKDRLKAVEKLAQIGGLDQMKLLLEDHDAEQAPDAIQALANRIARRRAGSDSQGPSDPAEPHN